MKGSQVYSQTSFKNYSESNVMIPSVDRYAPPYYNPEDKFLSPFSQQIVS